MVSHYLDSSAWVKRFVAEEGSQRVNQWMAEKPLVVSSALGIVEVLSTVVRKTRAGELTESRRRRVVAAVHADFEQFGQVYLTAPVTERSESVALEKGLRGADTVHLASALWLEDHLPSEVDSLVMITSDRELAEAAESEGIDVFDPTPEPLPLP